MFLILKVKVLFVFDDRGLRLVLWRTTSDSAEEGIVNTVIAI